MSIPSLLSRVGLSRYAEIFEEEAIESVDLLLSMGPDMLRSNLEELGLTPDAIATLEAELKAREEDGGKAAVKRGKKRGGGGGDLGNLGDLTGGSLDAELEPRVKAKPSRAKPKAAKKRAKKKKKTEDDDFIDDEEDFVDEMSETDEEFDPDEIVPPRETTRSRSGRVVRKRYTDGDDDDESDEEPTKRRTARNVKEEAPMASLDGTGTLAGSLDAPFAGSLAATAGDVGEDEDDYD